MLKGTWGRHRKFSRSQREANAFADSRRTKIANERARCLALSDDLQIVAVRCAKRLKPFGFTIDQAVDHFIEYVKATLRGISVAALVDEYETSKCRSGKSARYLRRMMYEESGK